MDYTIQKVKEATTDLEEAFQRLVPQLSIARPPTIRDLEEMIQRGATTLLVARENTPEGRIIGALALVIAKVPTGVRAWIEDVVVEKTARNQGIGEELVRSALKIAGEKGARVVELTSNPARVAANHLYQQMGFVQAQTNFYRYYIDET